MASIRTTFTLDDAIAAQARRLDVNLSAAARKGVERAIRKKMEQRDREAYLRHPEEPDSFWDEVQAWPSDSWDEE